MIVPKEGQDSSVEYNICSPVVHDPEVADPMPFVAKYFFHVFQFSCFFNYPISYPIILHITYIYLNLGEVSE